MFRSGSRVGAPAARRPFRAGAKGANRVVQAHFSGPRDFPISARTSWRKVAIAAFVVYIACATIAVYLHQYRTLDANGAGLFDLTFGFGPLVESLVTEGRYASPAPGYHKAFPDPWAFTAHRMPAIPWFLAAVGSLANSVLFAMILKNALVAIVLFVAGRQLFETLDRRVALFASAIVPAALMPSMVNIGLSLQMEEGYLIAMMFLLFAYAARLAIRPDLPLSPGESWGLAGINAAMFLTKASMWPLMVANAAIFPMLARKPRTIVPFSLAALVAAASWGMHNRIHSGEFRLGNTWASWCLYKGNNVHTAGMYPEWSVDRMDHEGLVESPADFRDEWEYERHNKQAAAAFIRENPREFLSLTVRRLYVLLFSIRPYPTMPEDPPGSLPSRLAVADQACMAIFRIALLGVLAVSLVAWARWRNPEWSGLRRLSLAFWLILGAYSVGYVLGFGYQRHVLPLILPTMACAAAMAATLLPIGGRAADSQANA